MSNWIKYKNIWAMHRVNMSVWFLRSKWEFIFGHPLPLHRFGGLSWESRIIASGPLICSLDLELLLVLICLVWHMELGSLFKFKNNRYRIIALPRTISVTLHKLNYLSKPEFLHVNNEDRNNKTLQGEWRYLSKPTQENFSEFLNPEKRIPLNYCVIIKPGFMKE